MEQRNTHLVFCVERRPGYEAWVLCGETLAVSGHDAIQQHIAYENEEVSPLAANDFVAVPKWAAHKCHYEPPRGEELVIDG